MKRILLVDDDDAFRTMLRLTLVRLGYAVTEAVDGRQALSLCECELPDLVLTDLVMPEKEGLEIIQLLRSRYPALGIVAMSGGARINTQPFLHVAKALGAHAALEKPFSSQEMEIAIGETLRGSEAPRSEAAS